MNKKLFLPLLILAVFVSQAMAVSSAPCTSNSGGTLYYCDWGGTDGNGKTNNCWKLDNCKTQVGGVCNEIASCLERATACINSGTLYSTTSTNVSSDGYCDGLNTSTSVSDASGIGFDIPVDTGEGPCLDNGRQLFCQQAWGCMTLNTQYSSIGEGAAMTCGPPGNTAGVSVCTCSQLRSDCPTLYVNVDKEELDKHNWGNDQVCTDFGGTVLGSGPGPIEPPPQAILPNGVVITGLNVVHFARSLQIATGKDATVSLFDMHGKQVFSKKVLAGESVVSLENQRQGVYYAVVRSGSLKQTVKVVLK